MLCSSPSVTEACLHESMSSAITFGLTQKGATSAQYVVLLGCVRFRSSLMLVGFQGIQNIRCMPSIYIVGTVQNNDFPDFGLAWSVRILGHARALLL